MPGSHESARAVPLRRGLGRLACQGPTEATLVTNPPLVPAEFGVLVRIDSNHLRKGLMLRTSLTASGLAVPLLSFVLTLPTVAQCDPQWLPGAPAAGVNGSVYDAVLRPNGELVVGGRFLLADSTFARNVARFDGVNWHALGSGVDNNVFAVVEMPNGDVVVGGEFLQAGGAGANRIARWDGTSWSPLGTGLDGRVSALLLMPNGDLIAGGAFLVAGGAPANRIARWDGATWSPLGAGLSGPVECMRLLPNGNLIVGGSFTQAAGIATQSIAIWNGTSWAAVPGLSYTSTVFDVAALPNGQIAVAGLLSIGSATAQVVILNGPAVQVLTPPPGLYNELEVLGNGDLVVGGYVVGMATGAVARWNGTAWTSFGDEAPGRTFVFRIAANGDLIAAGTPLGNGATAYNAVARYDGTSWTGLGAPRPAKVNAMARLPDGDVVVAGEFTHLGGVAANHVARWHAGAFLPLGLGVDGPVRSLAVDPAGTVVVCGSFTAAGGGPANRIARWNGNAWSSLGSGLPFVATEVTAAGGGQVLVRGGTERWYFDGSTWAPLQLPVGYNLTATVAAPEGDFILGGLFTTPQGTTGTIRFDHGVFTPTQPQPWFVTRFGTDHRGRVLANVTSLSGGSFLRLDGNTWTSLPGTVPTPLSITSLPNGDPLVLSNVGSNEAQLFRHDGTGWTPFSVTLQPSQFGSAALHAACSGNGEVFVGGDVVAIQGAVTAGFARAAPACPAIANSFGTGCTGAAGPLTLVAHNLPWLGGTFESTASGLTANSLAVHVLGTQPTTIPLPLGAPGCSLFVTPDITSVLLPANGQAESSLALPRSLALAGLAVRTQVVGLEFAAGGALLRLTSTNALALTLGGM